MITDNFQILSTFFDQQLGGSNWISGIGSVSMKRKDCRRIFCEKTSEQLCLKFRVEGLAQQFSG